MNLSERIAHTLLSIHAVKFSPHQPITFKSGIVSPIYVDNRIIPFYPAEWRVVIQGFQEIIASRGIVCEILAGIETAGIPHSAALGYATNTPSVFVRKALKNHGTKNRIEGGAVDGKHVVLVEDMVTTGASSLAGVTELRKAGACVEDCIAIIQYNFKETRDAFDMARVRLNTLTTFAEVIAVAMRMHIINEKEKSLIDDWFHNPHEWTRRLHTI